MAYQHSPAVRVASQPPINRLPVELHVSIFAMVGAMCSETELMKYDKCAPKVLRTRPCTNMGWAKAMLVCRHWREVGISAPHLWRIISVTRSRESLEYRLGRSTGSTIDVILDDSEDPGVNVAALPLLLANVSRIRSIQTQQWFHFSHLSTLKPLFLHPLPVLERVNIVPTWSDETERQWETWPAGDLPAEGDLDCEPDIGLSEIRHPRIRHLIVAGVCLPTPSTAWALSTLDISIDFYAGYGSQATDLLAFLRSVQSLKSLRVVPYFGERDADWFAPSCIPKGLPRILDVVDLPLLDHICIQAPYTFITVFFEKARLHRVLSFVLSTQLLFYPSDIDDIAEAMDPLIPDAVREGIFERRSTQVQIGPYKGFYGYGFSMTDGKPALNIHRHTRADPENNLRSSQDDCHFHLQLGFIEPGWHPLTAALQTLSRVCDDIELGTLEVLEGFSQRRSDDSQEPWIELFATFPDLHTLSFLSRGGAYSQWNKHVALDALLAYTRDPVGDGAAALRNLFVDGLNAQNTLQMHDDLDTMLKILHARHERGFAKLDSLCLCLSHKSHTPNALANHRIEYRMHRHQLFAMGEYCERYQFQVGYDPLWAPYSTNGVAGPNDHYNVDDALWLPGGAADGSPNEGMEMFKERFDKRILVVERTRRRQAWSSCFTQIRSRMALHSAPASSGPP